VTYGACFGSSCSFTTWRQLLRRPLQARSALRGMAAGSFGLLALFARAVGACSPTLGAATWATIADPTAVRADVGRGCRPALVPSTNTAAMAIVAMISFGLFTHMACGAT